MATPLALVFDLIAHDNASAAFTKVGASAGAAAKETSSLGSAFAKAGGVIALAGVAVAAVSVKMAADFQEATTQLVTGAGESEKNIKLIRDGLISMAPAVGIGPTALAKAMFLVESAGYHGADGLKVMKAAAEGAKVGGAEATVVANALTTAMTDYRLPTSQAADVTSKLVATVAAGKTNMTELAGSLSAVLPSAAAAKVSLSQVLGAMGTMTSQGISAQQAAQNLANTIRSLSNPSAVASKAMAQIGLNSTTVAKELGKKGLTGTMDEIVTAITKNMGPAGLVLQSSFNESKLAAQSAQTMLKGLPPSLQGLAKEYLAGTVTAKEWTKELKSQPALTANLGKQFATTAKQAFGFSDTLKSGGGAAKTFNAVLSDVTGGSTGLNTALALTGGNMATFKTNTENISKATSEAGGHVKGWAETQKDLKTQLAQAQAGIEAMGVKIGTALIPVVQSAIDVGVKWSDWMSKHQGFTQALVVGLGSLAAVAVVVKIASLASAAATGVASAAQAVWSAVVGTSIGETLALKAMYLGSAIASGVMTAAQWLLNAALTANPIGIVVVAIGALVAGIIWVATKTTWFQTIWEYTWGAVKVVIGNVVSIVIELFRKMLGVWTTVIGGLLSAAATVAEKLHLPFAESMRKASDAFNGMAKAADQKLKDVATSASKWGDQTGKNYAAGLGGAAYSIKQAAANLGLMVAQGFASGIRGGTVLAEMAATSMAAKAQSAMAANLRAHSPSQVFHDLGLNVGAGFANGIDASRAGVAASMGRLVTLPTTGSLDFASSSVRSNAISGTSRGATSADIAELGAIIRALPKTYQMGMRQGAR